MAHRVSKGLVGGCALLLGVAVVSACGAPQFTYVANSGASTYFKVPYGWHQIGATSLSDGEKASGGNFLSFNLSQPFVFAETGGLSSTEEEAISYDALKDAFLPVSSSAQQQ